LIEGWVSIDATFIVGTPKEEGPECAKLRLDMLFQMKNTTNNKTQEQCGLDNDSLVS